MKSNAKQLFFNISNKYSYNQNKYLVNTGNNDDCGFRAVAISLIDVIFSETQNFIIQTSFDSKILKKLINKLEEYFPQHKSNQKYVSAIEKLQYLIRILPMSDLIATLSYVLRQMAVDEMYESPEKYRNTFIQADGYITTDMRKPDTWINESVFAALAEILHVNIDVSVLENNKDLPLKLNYRPNNNFAFKQHLNIQKNENIYEPKVVNTKIFGDIKDRPIKPKNFEHNDPKISDILDKINHSDKQIMDSYIETVKSLQSSVNAEELSLDDLLELYIKSINSQELAGDRIRKIDFKPRSQDYESYVDSITENLIHELAVTVSMGYLSEENLFDFVEKHQHLAKQ